jgi:hypothetical protein
MSARALLVIVVIALICLAATYVGPWIARRHDDDEIAGTHDEWDGGDTTNWKG